MLSVSVGETTEFRPKRGNRRPISAVPVTLELGKFLCKGKNNSSTEWKKATEGLFRGQQVPSAGDVCHAVAALFSSCLPDVTLPSIYRALTQEGSRTLLLLRDTQEVLNEWTEKSANVNQGKNNNSDLEINNNPAHSERNVNSDDDHTASPLICTRSWTPARSFTSDDNFLRTRVPSIGRMSDSLLEGDSPFSELFSDDDYDNSEGLSDMEQEDEEEDLSRGLETFLNGVLQRRRDRTSTTTPTTGDPQLVGLEHRLLAAATFQKNYRIPGTKVLHIVLLSVRKKWRRCGIGKFLIKRLKNPSLVGPYDALVLRTERPAQHFFLKRGFTDDTVLNSRFRDLNEVREGGKPMCYLPPFDGNYPPLLGVQEWSSSDALCAMDEEIDRWRGKSLEAYQAQVTCMTRLHQEVRRLHGLLKRQEASIIHLRKENQKLQVLLTKAEKRSTRTLLEALEKEAALFEKQFGEEAHQSSHRTES